MVCPRNLHGRDLRLPDGHPPIANQISARPVPRAPLPAIAMPATTIPACIEWILNLRLPHGAAIMAQRSSLRARKAQRCGSMQRVHTMYTMAEMATLEHSRSGLRGASNREIMCNIPDFGVAGDKTRLPFWTFYGPLPPKRDYSIVCGNWRCPHIHIYCALRE